MASSKISNVERLPFATCSRQTSGRINQRLELDVGSRSAISTLLSCSFAMVAAIFTAQAVLPTPPLKLINARTFALIGVDYITLLKRALNQALSLGTRPLTLSLARF